MRARVALLAVTALAACADGVVAPEALDTPEVRLSSSPDLSVTALDGRIVFVSGRSSISTVDPNGGNRRDIGVSGWTREPAISPDGSLIAYGTSAGGSWRVWMMNADGTDQRPLVGGFHANFSPDGGMIAYQSSNASGQIYGVPVSGGTPTRLSTVPTFNNRWADWSPDGTRIVYSSVYWGGNSLVVEEIATQTWSRLTFGFSDGFAAWSPAGDWIAYQTVVGGYPRVAVVRPDGTGQRIVVTGRYPEWSPDGQWILFTTGSGLSRVRLDGTGETPVPNTAGALRSGWGGGTPPAPDGPPVVDITSYTEEIDRGSEFTATVDVYDPGADDLTATVDYGDGSGPQPVEVTGPSFELSRTYSEAGEYLVTVRVADDDSAVTASVWIRVLSPQDIVQLLVDRIVEGGTELRSGELTSLVSKLRIVVTHLDAGRDGAAERLLDAVAREMDALRRSGRIDPVSAGWDALLARIRAAMGP